MTEQGKTSTLLADGTVYSKRKNFRPFSTPPLEAYASIVGNEKIEGLQRISQELKGLKILELNATAQGGGVAEMLYSSTPFLNALGIDVEWKVISGSKEFFESTKTLHNLLQGKKGKFTSDMQHCYMDNLENCAKANLIDYNPDVVMVNDPQPLGLTHYLKKPEDTWFWRCHIDIEEASLLANHILYDFLTDRIKHCDAAIYSAPHHVISRWPLPKFIIPPFIDPLSEKNRELTHVEMDRVLAKYHIDPKIPIIAQIGRFDPWKGILRTIDVYRMVRKERKCQLVLAGGLAADDPEGERILNEVYSKTQNDDDIHILNLQMANRLENWVEVNALQRAAHVIMQPSTKEGFGLVITEALWKSKPVIAADVGGISLQIMDGDTGYFYRTPLSTAQKVLHLLEHPKTAMTMGEKGRRYVKEHFLLPNRIADSLLAINMIVNSAMNKNTYSECIISFHPWLKMGKPRGD